MIDAALQTSSLCESVAPPRPTLRYGMETTDLLLCLGGVNTEGVPARRGGVADQSFCFAPRGRKTYYITSPLRDCGGQGQITAGVVTRNNNILVAIDAEDQCRRRRLDIYKLGQCFWKSIDILETSWNHKVLQNSTMKRVACMYSRLFIPPPKKKK